MRTLLLASMLTLLAPAVRADGTPPVEASQPGDDAYQAQYASLLPDQIEKRKIDALPDGVQFKRIPVQQPRMRSASFGFKVTLVVPQKNGVSQREYYVEHSASTNRPGAFFGPFPLTK